MQNGTILYEIIPTMDKIAERDGLGTLKNAVSLKFWERVGGGKLFKSFVRDPKSI